MSSSPQVSHSQSVLPLFMGKGRNVTFVLDSSVGMNGFLGLVKNLIIQTLITKASLRDSLFNIINFSYKVHLQWISLKKTHEFVHAVIWSSILIMLYVWFIKKSFKYNIIEIIFILIYWVYYIQKSYQMQ